jgi:hypothetical protein
MKGLRREVFYKTNSVVHRGDEFCQIELVIVPDSQQGPFEVRTFRGFAGTPPRHPVDARSFPSAELAEQWLEKAGTDIRAEGFLPYDPLTHGPDRPF